jgi:uncharacterized protein
MEHRTWIVAGLALTLAGTFAAACSSGPRDPAAAYAERITEERAQKDKAFRRQVNQPIPADRMNDLLPLKYYSPNQTFEVPASFKAAAVRTPVKIPTSTGLLRDMEIVGSLDFMLSGQRLSLLALSEAGSPPDRLFVPFADLTTGSETYGAGRYMEVDRSATGVYVVDFNRAFQPFCSYNSSYDCPYPPPQNRLPVAIRAGERLGQPALPHGHSTGK